MIEAIEFAEQDGQQVWFKLQQVIIDQGGQIKTLQKEYLRAVFTTSMMSFNDDLQARLDLANKKIQLRSSSRIGYYDFGVNRVRLVKLLQAMRINLNPDTLRNINE